MKLCYCGEPAEIKWKVNGEESRRQEHTLCSNCMSRYWNEIQLKGKGSNALEVSTFEKIY